MQFGEKDIMDMKRDYIIIVHNNIIENHNNYFKLILFHDGKSTIMINGDIINIQLASIICLDNLKQIKILSTNELAIKTIYFDPIIINQNMDIKTLQCSDFRTLAEKHCYLQLLPFIEHNDKYKSIIPINDYMVNTIRNAYNLCKEQLDEKSDHYWLCRTRSYFIEIIQNLERIYHNFSNEFSYSKLRDKKSREDFELILFHINANLNTSINLKQISKMFHTNRTKLEILFSQHLGMTFYEYISKQRIEKASYMLRFTDLPLSEISFRVGFSTTQNFSKFFKRKTNASPDKFRKGGNA